jgi:membrane-anchored protein YejM (alkaline phosphatase superfamily)
MPKLKTYSLDSLNFHNHYAVTNNTRGNIAAMLYGASSSITKVMGRKQSFRNNNLISLQKKLKENNYISSYLGTQPLFHSEKKNDNLDFDELTFLSPSMSDFYINAEKFNSIIKKKLSIDLRDYFQIFHYTDSHQPYETPFNILTRKDYPNIFKFHYRFFNLLYRIPRKFYKNYISPANIIKKTKLYKEYSGLKKLCENPFGPIASPERYSSFYEKVWSDGFFFNEYEKMMLTSLKYTDYHIDQILKFIKYNFSQNTLIFISSDHGNNGVISPNIIKEKGNLSEDATHIPLTILSFDKSITSQFNLKFNNYNFTSHTDLYSSILHLINPDKYDSKNTLFNRDLINKYVLSEINDSRYQFGECIMRSKDKNISLKIPPSDDLSSIKLIDDRIILNSISKDDYSDYFIYKNKYNHNFL